MCLDGYTRRARRRLLVLLVATVRRCWHRNSRVWIDCTSAAVIIVCSRKAHWGAGDNRRLWCRGVRGACRCRWDCGISLVRKRGWIRVRGGVILAITVLEDSCTRIRKNRAEGRWAVLLIGRHGSGPYSHVMMLSIVLFFRTAYHPDSA